MERLKVANDEKLTNKFSIVVSEMLQQLDTGHLKHANSRPPPYHINYVIALCDPVTFDLLTYY